MGKATYGTGTIFKRGRIWYLSYYANGQQVVRSSRSTNIQDAKRLRDQILGKKSRGELGDAASANVTCGELLDDLLDHAEANIKASTEKNLALGGGSQYQTVLWSPQGRKPDDRHPQGIPPQTFGGRQERVDVQSRTFNASDGVQPRAEMHAAESHNDSVFSDGRRDLAAAGVSD